MPSPRPTTTAPARPASSARRWTRARGTWPRPRRTWRGTGTPPVGERPRPAAGRVRAQGRPAPSNGRCRACRRPGDLGDSMPTCAAHRRATERPPGLRGGAMVSTRSNGKLPSLRNRAFGDSPRTITIWTASMPASQRSRASSAITAETPSDDAATRSWATAGADARGRTTMSTKAAPTITVENNPHPASSTCGQSAFHVTERSISPNPGRTIQLTANKAASPRAVMPLIATVCTAGPHDGSRTG